MLRDSVVDEPTKSFDRHVVGFDGVDGKETAGNLFLGDPGLKDTVGQAAADLVYRILYLCHRIVWIGADFELDERVRAALAGRRIERSHPVDRAHCRFHPLGDLVLDLGRSSAGLRDGDVDRRKFDVRIVHHIHAGKADQARQQESRESNQRNDWITDRPCGDIAEIHALIPRPA